MPRPTSALRAALLAATVLGAGALPAGATPFTVGTGVTLNVGQALTGNEAGTVEAGGTLSTAGVSIGVSNLGNAPGVVVDNSGTIQSTGNRGINATTGLANGKFTLHNNAGASLLGSDDAIRFQNDATGATIEIDNAGTIRSTTGQAVDFRGITGAPASITFNNAATGLIQSDNEDGLRAANGSVINNEGRIVANSATDEDPDADGINITDNHAATVNNKTGGSISGARHGVDIGENGNVVVTNEAGATITGRNGSGVGSDADGKVVNHGTITGAINDVTTIGDGDGVDIDFVADIENFGTIQGTGAIGNDPGEPVNTSEGIAVGGGKIVNHAGALVSGAHNGILVDDGSLGGASGAVTIENAGTIQGLDGYGVRIVGNAGDTVTNAGSIAATGGNDALDMGGGDDTLNLKTGASFTGGVQGGDGDDTVNLEGTGSLAVTQGFEQLNANAGTWSLAAGDHAYGTGATVASGATLAADGANLATATLQVNQGGTFDVQGAGATVTGDVVNNGTVRVTGATATFAGTFTNNGAYLADPSVQSFQDFVHGPDGFVVAEKGDVFRVAGDFLNHSTRPLDWDTDQATLQFTGDPGTVHAVELAGGDEGPTKGGFRDNFAWGALLIDDGNSLVLGNGVDPGQTVAFYVGELVGASILGNAITNLTGNGLNVYYNSALAANAYLGGLTYLLAEGGRLIGVRVVPEPATLALLLAGLGVAAAAARSRRNAA